MSKNRLLRLSAVQAIYQTMHDDSPLESVIDQFLSFHFTKIKNIKSGTELFEKIAIYANKNKDRWDEEISKLIKTSWNIERLLPICLSVLYCAFSEIEFDKKTSLPFLINEYIEISKGFVEKKDVGFINNILDNVGNKIRKSE